jgi:plasmid stabilization system protein ParE
MTTAAQQELQQEAAYSESRWGKPHSLKYMTAFLEKLGTLKHNPYLYRVCPELSAAIRLMTFKGNYVLYWINEPDKQVIVLGVPGSHKQLSKEALLKRAVAHGYTER